MISGALDAVAKVVTVFDAQGIHSERLPVTQAFHAPPIEPMLAALESTAARIHHRAPRVPLVLNLTGKMLGAGETLNAAYWRRHARETVRFHEGIENLLDSDITTFIEMVRDPFCWGWASAAVPALRLRGCPRWRKASRTGRSCSAAFRPPTNPVSRLTGAASTATIRASA